MAEQLYWERIGHVEIEDASGRMIPYYGLDFKFSVKGTMNIYNEFSVSVLGLPSTTINDLTVWSPVKAVESPRRIRVMAGYKSSGEQLVATGYIWYAVPTSPPEMWMNFECRRYLKTQESVQEPRTLENKMRKEVFAEVAKEMGMRSVYMASDESKTIPSFEISGSINGLVGKFTQTTGNRILDETGMLICIDNHGERKEPKRQILVNEKTGLLATSNIDIVGARITTRLRTDIWLDNWIKLESPLIPSANGNYYSIEVEHKGHMRGDDWSSCFRCIREQKK